MEKSTCIVFVLLCWSFIYSYNICQNVFMYVDIPTNKPICANLKYEWMRNDSRETLCQLRDKKKVFRN